MFLLFILDLNCSLNNLDKATARNTMEAALLRTLSDTQSLARTRVVKYNAKRSSVAKGSSRREKGRTGSTRFRNLRGGGM